LTVIEVTRSFYASIQDLGRDGYRSIGVPVSGVLDRLSAVYANALVGNCLNEAVVEAIGGSFSFKVIDGDAVVAVTGARTEVRVDDKVVSAWRPIWVENGSEVSISSVKDGFIVYVSVSGGFRIKKVMESKSTYYRAGFGGLSGRLLRPGDRLGVGEVNLDGVWDLVAGRTAPDKIKNRIPRSDSIVGIRVTRGVNYDLLKEEFENFLSNVYTVSPESDRMGYRLEGPVLSKAKSLGRLISIATDRGYIQVPPSGKPIILMSDAQTTGGYAVVAHVIPSDVDIVAQCAPGYRLRFTEVSIDEAEKSVLEYLFTMNQVRLIEEEVWGELF